MTSRGRPGGRCDVSASNNSRAKDTTYCQPAPGALARIVRYRGGCSITCPYIPAFTRALKAALPPRVLLFVGAGWLVVAPHDRKAVALACEHFDDVVLHRTDEPYRPPRQPVGLV